MATNAKLQQGPASNGVITAPVGNRKKQKRRAKQQAKAAATSAASSALPPSAQQPEWGNEEEDALAYGSADEYDYDEPDTDIYNPAHPTSLGSTNGYSAPPPPATGKKKNKKKKGSSVPQHSAYNPELIGSTVPSPPPPPQTSAALQGPVPKGGHGPGNIWNTSTQQERQNIKNFWLGLSEEDRKSLLKIEKEAVLRKMKQQQKHSCSCTVCGRKRTAIEEELEVLYEGYYEELEQYAHHDNPPLPSTDGMMPDPLQHRRPHPLAAPPPAAHHKPGRIQEEFDDDELSEEEEFSDEDEFSDDEIEQEQPRGIPDFFNFGSNLTVKDNLLTVADDLLKNDGRKFIEMMEQLAERRMARETDAEYAAANPAHPPGAYSNDPAYSHDDQLAGDDFEEDDASYDSQDDYDEDLDDEDEMADMSEEQRMQEGRRMFQIFAARMFEQRVLTAYREKVAAERQAKLLEELEDEDKLTAQREAKKQRDAEKKKSKKKQQQAAKAEEKARKEAEKAAEEARLKEAEEKKLEEQKRRKDEQRKKKEEEKRKQDEERAKKDAERLRRQQEDQQKREEAERRLREQRVAEKAKKDEARRREREEREAREREARERKAQGDRERKERDVRARAEKEAAERERSSHQAAQRVHGHQPPVQPPQITKRPSQPGMVAVPGVHAKQTAPGSGVSSPHPSVATPAVPKAPAPAKQRQASQQGSHASSPKQAQSQVSSAHSKSSSPGSTPQQSYPPAGPPRQIMQKPQGHMPSHAMPSTSPLSHPQYQPPAGMGHPQHHPGPFGNVQQPMGFPPYPTPPGQFPQSLQQRGPMPLYQPLHQTPPVGNPNRISSFGLGMAGMNGMPQPPPGMMPPHGRGLSSYPFDGPGSNIPPPGFGIQQSPIQQQTSPIGPPTGMPSDAQRGAVGTHSRQQSTDKERFESAANQPIARPVPIQRPSSVRPQDLDRQSSSTDVDDLSRHLGSSALLDDSDEPIMTEQDTRRSSNVPPGARGGTIGGHSAIGGFGAASGGFGGVGSWATPGLPVGQNAGLGQQTWGGLPSTGINNWSQSHSAFGPSSGFGVIGGSSMRSTGTGVNRPLAIRLALCQACKQLSSAGRGEGDGFHAIDVLLRQIESSRPMLDNLPTPKEIDDICETEGDSQNGGGELSVRRGGKGEVVAVKWEPDGIIPDQMRGHTGLGEIGSPMPSKPSPAGFGAPGTIGRSGFHSLGAVGGSLGS